MLTVKSIFLSGHTEKVASAKAASFHHRSHHVALLACMPWLLMILRFLKYRRFLLVRL